VSARHLLLESFDAALRAVDGCRAVESALRDCTRQRVSLFAVGKAASAMARGAIRALGPRVESLLLITKDGHVDDELRQVPRVTVRESAHPVPDSRSLAAGLELATRVQELPADSWPVFLVSGGSSSLVELLHDGRTLEELRTLNERGLASGWDIAALNTERARLSRLKRGGIARLLAGRPALALFLSDVPADDPGVIGSGLLGQDGGGADGIERVIVGNIGAAIRAASATAQARGLNLEPRADPFAGRADEVAAQFVAALRDTSADGLVWGGESTVSLPEKHGRGGRNTHLALTAARLLRLGEPVTILAAGSDGTDGPTSDAGAVIDAGTIERAELAGCDVERAWREFDSGLALEMSGDLVHTGPTGTNVGDLVIGIKHSAARARGRDPARVL